MLAPLLMAMMTPQSAPCSFRAPAGCTDSNWRYALGRPFERALARFTGRTRCTAYTSRSRPLAAVLLDATSGPPDRPVRVPDGYILFSAGRWHDGLDRGYVILTSAGDIVAVALSHPGESGDILDIYVGRRFSGHPAWLDPLLARARENAAVIEQVMPGGTTSVSIWRVSDPSARALRLEKFPLSG